MQENESIATLPMYIPMVSYILIHFADLIIDCEGQDCSEKERSVFTPLTWVALIGLISMLLPESAFSKGLYTFCMNGGMIIWFVREFFRNREGIINVNKV